MQPIRDYQRARGEAMALNAEEMADTIAEKAKDKSIPGAYSRETMERNSYDIFGKENRQYKAETLNDSILRRCTRQLQTGQVRQHGAPAGRKAEFKQARKLHLCR